MARPLRVWCAIGGAVLALSTHAAYHPSTLTPPAPVREFRGTWVASVGNITWPSKPGLPVEQQQAELLRLLDRAVQFRLNAVILQVRPAADALYASSLEPWSEYLTGTMGQAPKPYYDPLSFAVRAAHDRGLELHAWFNPFRARYSKAVSPVAANHLSRTRPHWVKSYGKFLWLDPGEPGVHDHTTSVILDVVRRYDIDGVHLDDYFYPYPEKAGDNRALEFPDDPSWNRFLAAGGKLSRDDWRRQNVDRFIQRLHLAIKAEKQHVQFGISPFGIWRPGHPASVKGFDAYAQLFADARKWLTEGWLDYCAPQLYWPINAPGQSFPALLQWWAGQNAKQRHLWPGISVNGQDGARTPAEIVAQCRLSRSITPSAGQIYWSARPLLENRRGIAEALLRDVYEQPALVPASPWISRLSPAAPRLSVETGPAPGAVKLSWEYGAAEPIKLWLLQTRAADQWTTTLHAADVNSLRLAGARPPDAIALRAVDRAGNLSPPTVVEKRNEAARR